jgi:hypothetical protein
MRRCSGPEQCGADARYISNRATLNHCMCGLLSSRGLPVAQQLAAHKYKLCAAHETFRQGRAHVRILAGSCCCGASLVAGKGRCRFDRCQGHEGQPATRRTHLYVRMPLLLRLHPALFRGALPLLQGEPPPPHQGMSQSIPNYCSPISY